MLMQEKNNFKFLTFNFQIKNAKKTQSFDKKQYIVLINLNVLSST